MTGVSASAFDTGGESRAVSYLYLSDFLGGEKGTYF